MFRLSVGRRLGLIVAVVIAAITLARRGGAPKPVERALDRSLERTDALVAPMAAFIESELASASALLEVAAASREPDEALPTQELETAGFIATEVIEAGATTSRLGASTNFMQRAAAATSIGSTRLLDGEVGVLMGTPIDGRPGAILVGAYNADGILVGLSSAESGESSELLLAVRNLGGEAVIFTPSRHNDREPIGEPDVATTALIDQVLDGDDVFRSTGEEVNGRDSVVSMVRIPGPEWVLIGATDVGDTGADTVPAWLIPGILAIGLLAFVPIGLVRTRLKKVVTGAQELYRDRLVTPLDDTTDDEIGILSRTLQSLDDRLHSEAEKRSRSAATLQHRASHDPLTGLANRGRLMEELTIALNNRNPVAVLFCDIDDFKSINDSQGHEGGDIVLKFVANQLASACGPTELIARFGGDEFCVLSRSEPQAARLLAGAVERSLDTNCLVNGNQLKIGGSVGLAIAKVTDTPDSILKSADLAMYREKERRRGLRNPGGVTEVEIRPEQIRLVYQPVVDLAEGNIVGVEVLARYMHPVLGMLDPSSFLPPGTERGMFDKFDFEILTRSIAQLSDWLSHGVVDERFTLSFNLSPDHVSDSDSTRQIFETLRQHRVPTTMVQLEVTEHKLLAHQDDLINSLTTLRERGLKVAIDDFGVEGSNVDRLVQIPSDTVKIDRSFVAEIDIDERAEARLKAILEIVTTEGRIPIAEGVERQRQAQILRELKVPFGQGYLWHAPISALALTPLLGRASRWTRRKPPPTIDR